MLFETALDEKLAELEAHRAWSPRLVSKLETFLRTADDWALHRANPYVFAEERGLNADEAVDLFVAAAKVGLFHMSWCLLCPGCGDAVQSFSTLRSLCSSFHCYLCSTDMETQLDDYVQVGFTVSPQVRTIAAHEPSKLAVEDYYFRYRFTREARVGPGGPRFVEVGPTLSRGMAWLEPGEKRQFSFVAEPGVLAVYDISTNSVTGIVVAGAHPPGGTQTVRISEGRSLDTPRFVAPGPLTVQVENDTDRRSPLLLFFKEQAYLDEAEALVAQGKSASMVFDRYLTGRKLLTSHTFRDLFTTETIKSSDGLGVRDVSILFTDLKGSTALYDRIGDLKAFALVNQHFELLGKAIVRNRGAVVKTIGDAVMASFETPDDAVHAAVEMLTEIQTFNRAEGEREIVLKVGVHRGASIAVTLNDRLDFFGQTVNIAARVQALADADELYLTEEVYAAPGVKQRLESFAVTPQEASLKGVQRAVQVYRVAASA